MREGDPLSDVVELDTPGAMIRWAREQAGLTQTDVGNAMNVSRVQVNRWEAEIYTPTADAFIHACHACGFNVVLEPMVDE